MACFWSNFELSKNSIRYTCLKEFILSNRANVDTYQDEQRVRIASTRLAEVNYANYAEKLLEEATQKYGITL